MPPFVHSLDITDVRQIVDYFQSIPDMTEYILESDRYPYAALNEALKALSDAVKNVAPESHESDAYRRTISKIESVLSTRVDYVNSVIDHLMGKETFEPLEFSLDDSPTKEILTHIDLMKDVAYSPEINQEEYKAALRKFIKTLKFRFNKGLEIHKQLHTLEFEDIAERQQEFPQELLDEQRGFLADALTMTRNHVPVTATQIHQLKETLFKILEAMGVRILQNSRFQGREPYCQLLKEIEDVIVGLEVEFGPKIVHRFADLLPDYIAQQWSLPVIKHNRKLVELLIDLTDDTSLLQDLYQVLITLTGAEAVYLRKQQEAFQAKPAVLPGDRAVKQGNSAQLAEMERFHKLDLTEQARELIKVSLYGLCEYLSKLPVEEFRKYPIGILRSTDKVLRDLDQHRLKTSDVKNIRNSLEYTTATDTVRDAMLTYASSDTKHTFVDIYKETDYTVEGVTFCMFNDIILRTIQNITEAYFIVDSNEQDVSEGRLAELKVTIVERYKAEWTRQNDMQQEIEQQVMEELAEELA